jgi:hypothetical protein
MTDTAALWVDSDGDGFFGDEDCNDNDAGTAPSAPEICDGVDNDCDGTVDEGVMTISFLDADGDGYGDAAEPVEACDIAEGTVSNANDCDDSAADIHPGATEVCDGDDEDCDGLIDEDLITTVYIDGDGDGHGLTATRQDVCEVESGQVTVGGDCDDEQPDAWPGNPEVCDEIDNNCDGEVDEGVSTTYYPDLDGDGWGGASGATEACSVPAGYSAESGDCDDGDAVYHPGAIEDDCTDPNDYNCDGSVAYADADGDGWPACEDCDDAAFDVNPDALEICNSVDDDCNGDIDDADIDVDLSTGSTFYADIDTDGYGDADSSTAACAAPSGFVVDDTDCDDALFAVNPAATEVCDTIDNDCDDDIDDEDTDVDTSTGSPFYADTDSDGYGDAGSVTMACNAPSGSVANDSDCDDGEREINPLATEVCDTIDNDCDGDIDDADADVTGQSSWYYDGDSDGYGLASSVVQACFEPSGYVTNGEDCDDSLGSVSPAEQEVCNSIDDDCDGFIDDADSSVDLTTGSIYYLDADGDGYGISSSVTTSCSMLSGYSTVSTDCDDDSAASYPGATETCDGDDNDCDGSSDEALSCSYSLVTSDLSSGLCVDDDLYVNLNSSRIYNDTWWGSQCGHKVTFTATPGDTLDIFAIDSVGGCRSMSTVYIVLNATGEGQYLASGYSQTCGHGASSSAFWLRSVAVPGAF